MIMDIKISATLLKDQTFKNEQGQEVKYHRLVLHIGQYDKAIKLTYPEVVLIENLINNK